MKKCVTIYANVSVAEEVLEIIHKCGIEFYTCFPRIIGVGAATGPRLDSHVWPGANTGFQVVADAAALDKLMDELQILRSSETGRQSGIYAFMTQVDRVLE